MQPSLPSMYTPTLIASVQKHIDDGERTGEDVKAWDSVLRELGDNKLAEFGVQLDCETVGVSPRNRSSMGVDAYGSQDHGDEVLKVGYSKAKAADATCIQTPPPPFDKELIDMHPDSTAAVR